MATQISSNGQELTEHMLRQYLHNRLRNGKIYKAADTAVQ